MTRLAIAVAAIFLTAAFPAPAQAPKPENPCLDAVLVKALLCPDLKMKKPYGLQLDRRINRGRVVLRAGNSIDNVGKGPAELFGTRTSRYFMRARQRIYRRGGGPRLGINTGARLYFKYVAGQGRYWKFLYAAKFELWRIDSKGKRLRKIRRGPKVSYCLRDLKRTRPRARSPRRRVYPACNMKAGTRKVRLGTSVGWSDVYPASYPEQYLDVTGLRGCFAYRQTADPRNGVYESNETNNSSQVFVRLPFKPGPQHCVASDSGDPSGGEDDPYEY